MVLAGLIPNRCAVVRVIAPDPFAFEQIVESASFEVLVRPGSRTAALSRGEWRSAWVIHCDEPAEKGKANRRVLELLSKWISVPIADLAIRSGSKSRTKRIGVQGLSLSEVNRRLTVACERESKL